jgi:WG containing repeat
MRTAIITLVLMCSLVFPAAAADDPSSWGVRCGGPFQLCGYVERDTETLRIAKRYEAARPFHNGLASVLVEGRWGYIDRSGELVIQPIYTEAASFYGELAEVRVNEAAGIIDRRGRTIISPQFKRIIPFAPDVFIAVPLGSSASSHGLFGIDAAPDKLSGIEGAGLYHRRRGWLTASDLQFMAFDPARGLIWAGRRNEDREDVWGLMRADGSWQVTPRYSHVQWLSGGRAIVRSLPDRTAPPAERQASVLCEGGLTLFQANGRWGMRDGTARTVIQPKHRVLTCFSGGFAWAVSPGAREWCPIGSDGKRRRAFRCLGEVYPVTGSDQRPERFDDDPFENSVLWNLAMLDYLAGTRPHAPRWIPAGRAMGSDLVIGGLPQPERVDSGDGGQEAVRRFAPYAVGVMGLVALVIAKRHRSRTANSARSTGA